MNAQQAALVFWSIVFTIFAVILWTIFRAFVPAGTKKKHHRIHRYRNVVHHVEPGRQVAGAICESCGQKIVFDDDGFWCDECRQVLGLGDVAVHRNDCARLHHVTKHSEDDRGAPYR